MIRLTVPSIDEGDVDAVGQVLRTGYLVQGPHVAAFEEAVAKEVGVTYAVAMANCTAALHLGLLALNVRHGDRVAVTTYSWPATANVIALCGAIPVFVDIDPQTYNMDPEQLELALSRNRVAAILPVHAFGGMADMKEICAIADRHAIPVLEDAACALGSDLEGRKAGAWGSAGCFSFHPRKAITTGEGGIVTTNDPRVAKTLRILRNHGLDPDASVPDFVAPGYNVRLTEMQAALGQSQLKKLDRIIESRRKGAAYYDKALRSTSIAPPSFLAASRHVYQSYVAKLPTEHAASRSSIIAALRATGIEATIGTYHMPMTRYFRTAYGVEAGQFPITDDVAARAISLPLHETLSTGDQDTVVRTLMSLLSP